MTTFRSFIAIVGLAAILATTACSPRPAGTSGAKAPDVPAAVEPSAPVEPAIGQIGDTVTFESGHDAGTVILHTAEWSTQGNTMLADVPKHGAYLVLDVEVTCTAGTVTANPLFWSAQDPDGRAYNTDWFAFDGIIGSAEIPSGGHLRGYIVFDMPMRGPVTVTVTPIVFGPTVAFLVG